MNEIKLKYNMTVANIHNFYEHRTRTVHCS